MYNRIFIVLLLGISLSTIVGTAPMITQLALAQTPSQLAQMQQQPQQSQMQQQPQQSQMQQQPQQSQLPTLQQQQANPQQPSSPNDWGEVVSGQAIEGDLSHSSNPVPDPDETLPQDIDRETPRGGVGNQEPEKHPAFHANQLCTSFPNAPGCDNITP